MLISSLKLIKFFTGGVCEKLNKDKKVKGEMKPVWGLLYIFLLTFDDRRVRPKLCVSYTTITLTVRKFVNWLCWKEDLLENF